MNHKRWWLGFFVAMFFETASFGTPSPSPAGQSNGFQHVTAGGVTFSWMNDAENLTATLEAETTGWVSVGFAPKDRMEGANIVIGSIQDGEVHMRDDFGTGRFSHESDENLNWEHEGMTHPGRNNVTVLSAGETDKPRRTWISFSIPLNSGDPFDKVLVPGEKYRIILAKGSSDDFSKKHSDRGSAEIILNKVIKKKSGTAK